jgi:hypothetical protein
MLRHKYQDFLCASLAEIAIFFQSVFVFPYIILIGL